MHTIAGARTLRSLLERRARESGDRPFVDFDDLAGGVRRQTYAAFDASVNRAAGVLARLGIGRGDTVDLHLPNGLAFLWLWFAAAKIGARVMPTNVAASADELAWLVEHSRSRIAFTTAEHLEPVEEAASRCGGLESVVVCGAADAGSGPSLEEMMDAADEGAPAAEPGPDDVVGILYTSGTTARPKGVLVTNANYVFAGETVAKAIALRPDDRHLVVLPLFHGNAQYYSTMSTLVTGASMALMARFSASDWPEQAIRHRCTVASLFAAPIRMILVRPERPAQRENALRVVLFAQNVTAAQLDEWRRRFGAPLLQLWGMTETMGPPLMNPIHDRVDNMSLGLPTMGYRVKLVDDDGDEVGPQEVGQIVVAGEPGETLMAGYADNPEASAETLRDGWLWSGDNARRDEHGYFHFVDRAKDMIKRAGENVAASEVEAVVLAHPDVFDCAVIGIPDPVRDETIKAFVVRNEGADVDAGTLIAWCAERLASFRVPGEIEFREALPRTSVGKIQKHLLRAGG